MTSATAQRVYDGLPEFYRLADTNGLMLALVESLVDGMGVGDTDTALQTFADRLLTDIDTMPIAWVRWLSQHLGVQFNPAYGEDEQRTAVQTATSGWRSGTIPALEDAVRAGIRPVYAEGTHLLTEGGYYTTTDVNLLPADDAHFHQSGGSWIANINASVAQSTDVALFGDASLKNTVPAGGVSGWMPTIYSLSASTQYTASVWVRPSVARNLRIRHTDDGGATHEPGGYTACPAATWTELALTFTTYGGSTQGRMIVETDANATAGEVIYSDQACLREGADGSFVPSVYIQGAIDVRARSDAHFGLGESIIDLHDSGNGYALRNAANDGTLTAVIGANSVNSSAVVPFQQYDVGWNRFVAQDSGADKVVDFYTADDEDVIFWETLGTQQTIVGASGDPAYVGLTTLGVLGPTNPAQVHKFIDGEVLDGIDGPKVLDFDAADFGVGAVGTAPQITDTHGRVWTATGVIEVAKYPDAPYVEVTRHEGGDIWTFGVATAADESPSDTSIIANAIEEAQSRPAGFQIVFSNFTRTWTEVESTFPTWTDWTPNTWGDLTYA